MAKVNRCKICGTTDPKAPAKWVGTNNNLCSDCIVTCPSCKGSGQHHFFGKQYKCGWCNGRGTCDKDRACECEKVISTPEHRRSKQAVENLEAIGELIGTVMPGDGLPVSD